jgi:hypothetical protein
VKYTWVLVLALSFRPAFAADGDGKASIESADALFVAGRFAEAARIYTRVAERYPTQYQAVLRLGYLALLGNRFDDAERWLSNASELRPGDAEPKRFLGECYYRQDKFDKAVPLLRAVGLEAKAKKLEAFKGQTPYVLRGQGESTTLKFVRIDPLPLVNVRVNGKEATFFIDTGAAEVVLDTDFARELGVQTLSTETGTFAGGKKSSVGHGRIDSITLGNWTVENVPVGILHTRVFSKDLEAKQIDGIIGTVLFYHFLTTMDYPKGELVLRRKHAESLKPFAAPAAGRVVIPFWMADDHFMVALGRIDHRAPAPFFIDSGLPGADVKLAEDVITEAGVKLQRDKASEGLGAGGKVTIIPFELAQLSLGDIVKKNAQGVYDGPFSWEHSFGFRLVGMIGHDFYRPYAVTFDFARMRMFFDRRP